MALNAVVLVFALGVLGGQCWAADDPDVLRQDCVQGDGSACYRLALRHQSGQGVPLDRQATLELLWRGCEAGSSQSCFTGCLQRIPRACAVAGHAKPFWETMRQFLALPDLEHRLAVIAPSRDLDFLLTLVSRLSVAELQGLPDADDITKAVRGRVAELAQADPDPGIRWWAVRDMYSGIPLELVRQVATSDPSPEVRKAAQEKLVEWLGPAWNKEHAAELARMAGSPDPDTRRLAVGRIVDVALLTKIAEKDRDAEVRSTAADRLGEFSEAPQGVLLRIAERDKDEGVRISAAASLTDPKAFEKLLRTSSTPMVREIALGRLEEKTVHPSLALWIAEHDRDEGLRARAARLLEDQATLAGLARSSSSVAVRTVAAAKLKDQALLGEIAARDSAADVWRAALAAISDERVLAEVVRRRPEDGVLERVAAKATDQTLLVAIARTAKDWSVRRAAVARLTDVKSLEEIAASDAAPMVRAAAQERLLALQGASPRP